MRRPAFIGLMVALALAALAGSCAVVQQGTEILAQTGKISESDKNSIIKTTEAIRSTFSDITEEEEYYIGRSVAAMVLDRYPAYNNDSLTRYINTVGNAVSYFSDRPETFAGYHFLVLDTDEVNAMAAPGGFIFISKGLLKRCKDEETLAAILAHEIGHITKKHGLQSIKKSRLIDAFKILGTEAVQRYGSEQLAQLTGIFEGVLGDVVESLIERGYDRKYEYEADQQAVAITVRTGYSPVGLGDFLQTMIGDKTTASGKGWFKTHPSPEDRMGRVKAEISSVKNVPLKADARTSRFKQSLGNLK